MKTLYIVLLLLAKTLDYDITGEILSSPVTYGVDLPEWINDNGYLGISDPMDDTISAYNQAVQRAVAFYAIATGMNISSVYEYYYLEAVGSKHSRDNQKSHWIAEFDTEVKDISYKVDRVYRTKHKETIVLLNVYDDGSREISLEVSGSFMYHYEYYNNKASYGEKQLLTITSNDSIKVSEWDSTIEGYKNYKKSFIDGEENVLKKNVNTYNDYGKIDDEMVFCKNDYGLWNSFIDTFFQAVSIFESENVLIKNTYRQITQEDNGLYEDKHQNIARLVMRTNISCSFSNISFKNNTLYANWEINER